MRKRITALLAAVLMLALCMPAQPVFADETGECGKNAKWKLTGSTLTVSGTGAMTDYESVWDTPWIDYASQISKVVIKDGITRVGKFAFFGDTGSALTFVSLRQLSLGNTVASIGPYAFTGAGFTKAEFPASLKKIGDYAFEKTALRSVDCSNLDFIGAYAFSECDKLGGTVAIGPNVTKNLDTAFYGSPVTGYEVSGDNSVYSSLKGILYNKAQTTLIQFPEGKSATTFTVPDTVTTIEKKALANAVKIKTLVFPDSVKTIKDAALPEPNASIPYGKSVALEKVFFGKGLKKLAVNIFTPTTEATPCYTAFFAGNIPAKIGEGAEYWGWHAPVAPGYVYIVIPKGNTTWEGAEYDSTWFGTPAIKSLKNSAAGTAAVKYGKSASSSGYQIQYSSSKTFSSSKKFNVDGSATVNATISGLKKGKTYYVRVRAYRKAGSATFYTGWSEAKSVKISK